MNELPPPKIDGDRAFVLVTGGASGIGAGIVQRSLADGYQPIVLDRVPPPAHKLVSFIETDLLDAASLRHAVTEAAGMGTVCRLVNNVGTAIPGPIENASVDHLRRMVDLNLVAAVELIQALVPTMKQARFGRIVNITSRSALGRAGMGLYAATKAAVNGLTKSWALELAPHGVTMNAVGPGVIATSLLERTHPPGSPERRDLERSIPAGHPGEPGDIAAAVSFFLSSEARYVTGQVLYVCGGTSLVAAS